MSTAAPEAAAPGAAALSRRTFLRRTAAVGAAVLAVGLGAVVGADPRPAQTIDALEGTWWTEEHDFTYWTPEGPMSVRVSINALVCRAPGKEP